MLGQPTKHGSCTPGASEMMDILTPHLPHHGQRCDSKDVDPSSILYSGITPIARLPPEILETIFSICVSWIYGHRKPRHRLSWSQVCSSWRRISLGSSRLWQRIDLCQNNPRFADEFLVRSKQAPLFITSTSLPKLTTDCLIAHASRLQSIDLFLLPEDMIEFFGNVGGRLTSLTNLSLKVPPISRTTIRLDVPLPSVRRLSLDCVSVRWEGCRELEYLALRGLNPDSCPSIDELHTILSNSPHIQYVRLENISPSPVTDTQLSPRYPIKLLHLTDFIVSSKPSIVRSLFENLQLGPRTRLQLYLSHSEDLQTLLPNGLPYIRRLSRPHSLLLSPPTHKPTHTVNASTLRLSRHTTLLLLPGAPAWSEDPSRLLFSLSAPQSISSRVCLGLSNLLDVGSIKHLELNSGVLLDVSPADLQSLFGSLWAVERLSVGFNDLAVLLSTLSQPQREATNPYHATSLNSSVYLPNLTTISFSKPSDTWWHFGELWASSISSTIQARRNLGAPIRTLEFSGCRGLGEERVREMEDVVERVVVNGSSAGCC